MSKPSAGLLAYRYRQGVLEVLLVHPGGPFWAKKDAGAWSIPKGEILVDEDPVTAAKREFQEETGFAPAAEVIALGAVRQPGGKMIHAWAFQGDFDLAGFRSNVFTMEWPPRSGKQGEFPEADRAGWFSMALAREKLLRGQVGFLEALEAALRFEG